MRTKIACAATALLALPPFQPPGSSSSTDSGSVVSDGSEYVAGTALNKKHFRKLVRTQSDSTESASSAIENARRQVNGNRAAAAAKVLPSVAISTDSTSTPDATATSSGGRMLAHSLPEKPQIVGESVSADSLSLSHSGGLLRPRSHSKAEQDCSPRSPPSPRRIQQRELQEQQQQEDLFIASVLKRALKKKQKNAQQTEACAPRRPSSVLVLGEPGVGKTFCAVSIVEAWARDASERGYISHDIQGTSDDSKTVTMPIPDAVAAVGDNWGFRAGRRSRRFAVVSVDCRDTQQHDFACISQILSEWLFHVEQLRGSTTVTKVVTSYITTAEDELYVRPILALFDAFVDTRFGPADDLPLTGAKRREGSAMLLSWLLRKLAADIYGSFVLLVIEDAHLMDSESWDIVSKWIEHGPSTIARVLITSRSKRGHSCVTPIIRDACLELNPTATFVIGRSSDRKALAIAAAARGCRIQDLPRKLAVQIVNSGLGVPLMAVTMALAHGPSSSDSRTSMSAISESERFSVRSLVRTRIGALPALERLVIRVVARIATVDGVAPLYIVLKVVSTLSAEPGQEVSEEKITAALTFLVHERLLKWTRVLHATPGVDRRAPALGFVHDVYRKGVGADPEVNDELIHDEVAYHLLSMCDSNLQLHHLIAASVASHLENGSRSAEHLDAAARANVCVAKRALEEGLWTRCVEKARSAHSLCREALDLRSRSARDPLIFNSRRESVHLPVPHACRHIDAVHFSAHRLGMSALQSGQQKEEAFQAGTQALRLIGVRIPVGRGTPDELRALKVFARRAVRGVICARDLDLIDDEFVADAVDIGFRMVLLHMPDPWSVLAAVSVLVYVGVPWQSSVLPDIMVQYRWGIGMVAGVRKLMQAFSWTLTPAWRVAFPKIVLRAAAKSLNGITSGKTILPFDSALVTSAQYNGLRILKTCAASRNLARAVLGEKLEVGFDPLTAWCSAALLLGNADEVVAGFAELDQTFSEPQRVLFMTPNNIEARCRLEGFAFIKLGHVDRAKACAEWLERYREKLAPDRQFCLLVLKACVAYLEEPESMSSAFVAAVQGMLSGMPHQAGSLQFMPPMFVPMWHACEVIAIAFCSEAMAPERPALLRLLEQVIDVMRREGGAFPWLLSTIWFWHGRLLELSGDASKGYRAINLCYKLLQKSVAVDEERPVLLGQLFIGQVAYHFAVRARSESNTIEQHLWIKRATEIWQASPRCRFFLQQPATATTELQEPYALKPAAWGDGWGAASTSNSNSSAVKFLNGVTLAQRIGVGAFGDVYVATWNGTQVAAKTVDRLANASRMQVNSDHARELEAEAKLLAALRHPNVVTMYGAAEVDNRFCFVMEFVRGGSAWAFVVRRNSVGRPLGLAELLVICRDMCAGMEFLRAERYVHCDLALRNLLVAYVNGPNGGARIHVKVSDLGMAKVIPVGQNSLPVTGSIAARWSAPCVVRKEQRVFASDVWSAGVTMWEAFSHGIQPFADVAELQAVATEVVANRIATHLQRPSSCPEEFFSQVILPCWQYEPAARPTFTEIGSLCRHFMSVLGVEDNYMGDDEITTDSDNAGGGDGVPQVRRGSFSVESVDSNTAIPASSSTLRDTAESADNTGGVITPPEFIDQRIAAAGNYL